MRKTALITGSSRGIGRAVAAKLASDGYAVCINYIERRDKAEELVKKLEAEGREAMCFQADVADAKAVNAMVKAVEERFGPVTLLVNNAGIAKQCLFQDMSHEYWKRIFDVNLNGTFNATRLLDTDVFFNTDNKLTRPDTTIENANLLKGFRAYFSGILGDVASAQVSFGDVVTSIDSIDGGAQFNADKVYSIDGQYIGTTTAGLKKGIYIVGNKKVVVK